MHLCSLVVGLSSDGVQCDFWGTLQFLVRLLTHWRAQECLQLCTFPITSHHTSIKEKRYNSRTSQVYQWQRILSRQQIRKPHFSLQSGIRLVYFVPLITQAGEWKREQKCISTGATLFSPLSASQSDSAPRTRSSPSPLHLLWEAWAGCALRWFPLTHPADSFFCQRPLPKPT